MVFRPGLAVCRVGCWQFGGRCCWTLLLLMSSAQTMKCSQIISRKCSVVLDQNFMAALRAFCLMHGLFIFFSVFLFLFSVCVRACVHARVCMKCWDRAWHWHDYLILNFLYIFLDPVHESWHNHINLSSSDSVYKQQWSNKIYTIHGCRGGSSGCGGGGRERGVCLDGWGKGGIPYPRHSNFNINLEQGNL